MQERVHQKLVSSWRTPRNGSHDSSTPRSPHSIPKSIVGGGGGGSADAESGVGSGTPKSKSSVITVRGGGISLKGRTRSFRGGDCRFSNWAGLTIFQVVSSLKGLSARKSGEIEVRDACDGGGVTCVAYKLMGGVDH